MSEKSRSPRGVGRGECEVAQRTRREENVPWGHADAATHEDPPRRTQQVTSQTGRQQQRRDQPTRRAARSIQSTQSKYGVGRQLGGYPAKWIECIAP
jgi:hypothetical protein